MTVKYYAILTNQGAARLANATMLGSKLNLTQMAVGDANGVLPTPDPAQTKLINQKRIAPLNLLSVDPNNQSQIIAEQIIPENEGGFWIREIGLYDDEGVLIAVANCPETYKPQLQEGSGRTQTIRMILVVTNTEAITLKIDPSVVLATRKYVDDEVLELKLYVDDQMRNHIAAQDPHTQYAQKHNPTFTGEPKAPTPAAGNNTTRIATTAFVQAAITALINGAPATLDTLKEIAAAINNDPKFSTTINNALSGKQPLDETLTHLSGKDVAGLLAYLGLGDTSGYVGRWVNTRVFTSSGTYTPTPGTKRIRVTITGGGGGGGGCQAISNNETFFGAGGGAGGTIISIMTPTQNSYPVTIGAGGAGGIGANYGLNGGYSSFASLIAIGGEGAGKVGVTNTNGGNGGVPSTGDIRITGGNGGDGQYGNINVSGEGGTSYWGGGGRAGAGGGVSGKAYGSGGGGAYDGGYSGTSMTGGKGAAGICIIEEFA
ncbi:TPA: phage tail protein [Escherichia coli]|nr:phage tail protein [Escherichia coli]